MENNINKEIDLVSVDWNNLSIDGFNSIYSQLSDRNVGKAKKKPKQKAVPAKRVEARIDGKLYMVLVHQLNKYKSIEDATEKAEYRKYLLECAEPVTIEEF